MVKEHILSAPGPTYTNLADLIVIEGIGPFLKPDECSKWLDPLIRTATSGSASTPMKTRAKDTIVNTTYVTNIECDDRIEKRLITWVNFYEERGKTASVEIVREIQQDVAAGIPF